MDTDNLRFGPTAVAVAVVACGAASEVVAQSVMQPGGWQMQSRITARNPATGESKNMGESTTRMCLTREFLAKDPYLTPGIDREKMERRNARCAVSDEQRRGSAASWKMSCQTADGSTVDMTIRNAASFKTLTSDILQTVTKGGEVLIVRIAIDSSYIGECSGDMPRP